MAEHIAFNILEQMGLDLDIMTELTCGTMLHLPLHLGVQCNRTSGNALK